MPNLSQEKRQRMLAFLDTIRQEHKDDDDVLIALGEIESELNAKKYGLVWEQHEEAVDVMMRTHIPVFTEDATKEISSSADGVYNFLLEGDNLHSLRLLEKTHRGRIDVIYIAPPYNRGKTDFRYDDNYVVTEDAYRHSKWTSFMKARHGLPESAHSSEAYIKLKPDGTFHEMRFYDKDHVLYLEIGYHAEKSLTGDNHTPVLHYHLYDNRFSKNKDGAFDRSNARRLTDEMKNTYIKYFKVVTNFD